MAQSHHSTYSEKGVSMGKPKSQKVAYVPFGFYKAGKIPRRPLFGYERQLEAGMGIGLNVADGERASLLAFGIPGTGKALFPCMLANQLKADFQKPFSLAYVICAPMYLSRQEDLIDHLSNLIRRVEENSPAILHLVELDTLGRPYHNRFGKNHEPDVASLHVLSWIRNLFSEIPKGTFLICTTSYPEKLDATFLNRFNIMFYFEPTNRKMISRIISEELGRNDAEKITMKFMDYVTSFGLTPLSGELFNACKLLKRNVRNVRDLHTQEVVGLLKRYTTLSFPTKSVEEYQKEHESYMKFSDHSINSWRNMYQEKLIGSP